MSTLLVIDPAMLEQCRQAYARAWLERDRAQQARRESIPVDESDRTRAGLVAALRVLNIDVVPAP